MRIKIFAILLVCFYFKAEAQEWVTLYTEAQKFNTEGDYTSSIEKGEQCLQVYLNQSGELNNNYASILRLLTTACYAHGEYEKGLIYGKKELAVRDNMGQAEDLTYGGTLYNLGSLQFMLQHYDEAAPLIARTLAIYEAYYPAGHSDIVACQWKLASIKMQQGEHEKAKAIFMESFAAYGNPEEVTMDYLTACYDFGTLLLHEKDFQQANNYFKIVGDIYEASGYGKSINNANVLNNIASCQYHLNKYEEALTYYSRAIAIYEGLNEDHTGIIRKIKNDQAVCLQALGRNDEAEQLLTFIGATSEKGNVASLINLAVLNQQQHNYDKAEALYKQALLQLSDSSGTFADIAEKLGALYTITGKYEEAAEQFMQAESSITATFGQNDPRYASLLVKKGALQKEQRNFEEAKKLYRLAEQIFKKANKTNNNEYATLLNGMAVIGQEQGAYLEAEALYRKSLALIRRNSGTNSSEYAMVLNNLAILLQLEGHLLEAQDLFKKVAATIKAQPDFNKASYAVALDNLGALYIQTGDYRTATEHLRESLKLKEAIYGNAHPLYAAGLINMARLEQAKGKYAEAEPLFKRAITLQELAVGKNHPAYANALNGMALLYQNMGNFKAAEPLWLEAKGIYKNTYGEMHPEYATTLENLATLYQLRGDHLEALPLLEEALRIDEAIFGVEHPAYGTTLHNLASLYQDLKQYEKAEALYQKALHIDAKTFGEKHPSFASTLYNIAILKQDLKKFDEAEALFKEVITIRKEVLGTEHPDYAYSLYGLASLYHYTKKTAEAEKLYRETINLYLNQIREFFPSLSDKEKSAFYAKIKPVFEAYQDFAVAYCLSGKKEMLNRIVSSLYNLQLSTKALLLNASNKVRNRILSSGDEKLISTFNEWINGKEQLVKFYTYTKEELEKDRVDLNAFEQRLNALEKILSARSALFASEFENKIYTWRDVQKSLKENEAALEILRIKKKYIADSVMYVGLIIKKDSLQYPRIVVMGKGNKLESRAFNYYRNAIKFSIQDTSSYNNFWKPIGNQLDGVNLVYVSSDGIYNKLNYNTLWNSENNEYLIDEIDLKIVSNTKEIISNLPEQKYSIGAHARIVGHPDFNAHMSAPALASTAADRAAAYGFTTGGIPDLPGTKTEIKLLNALLHEKGWSVNTYTKENATEENLKAVHSPKLLHIATHGFFMSDLNTLKSEAFGIHLNNTNANPLFRSGLLLTGASKTIYKDVVAKGSENGILTAYEAMNLDLDNTELVVLSACETGLGEIKNGEGVYGLQRAFVVAGAKAVIMSLWQVNDTTTQLLMNYFYEFWLNGDNKFEAFKKAQLKLRKSHNDPYHWGAFIILGT